MTVINEVPYSSLIFLKAPFCLNRGPLSRKVGQFFANLNNEAMGQVCFFGSLLIILDAPLFRAWVIIITVYF